jgi:hypothetical protein
LFVPCNTRDPLLSGLDLQNLALPSSGVVSVFTSEPWQALSTTDGPVVLHKWFGAPPSTGPVAVRAGGGGTQVFFQDASGALLAVCGPASGGSAFEMDAGGSVSVGIVSDFGNDLRTFIGVEPLDDLPTSPLFGITRPFGNMTVNMPTFDGAVSYRAATGCSSRESAQPTGIVVPLFCANNGFTFDVVGEALDENGHVLAYAIARNVDTFAVPFDLPALTPVNAVATVVPGSAVVDAIQLSVSLVNDSGIEMFQGRGQQFDGSGGSLPFYADTAGTPPLELLHFVEASATVGALFAFTNRTVRAPMTTVIDINVGDDLLPLLGEPSLSFTPDATVDITAGGSIAEADGMVVTLASSTKFWTIVAPPGLQLVAPPVPPGGEPLWITSADDGRVTSVQLDDKSFTPTYREYRQQALLPTQPNAVFTSRSTGITE